MRSIDQTDVLYINKKDFNNFFNKIDIIRLKKETKSIDLNFIAQKIKMG